MDLVEKQVFITSIFAGRVESIDNDKIVKEVNLIRSKDAGRKMPEYAGWHSNQVEVSDVEKTTEIAKVVKHIYNAAQDISNIIGYKGKLVFQACWLNINNPGNFNEQHRHPSTNLSAVYYVKAEENSGSISFIRDGRVEDYFPHTTNLTPHNAARVTEQARTNKFYIFPSYLDHKVDPNLSNEQRISMAFNFGFG